VDRAKFGSTRIGAGAKIDNLVQIAHNCQIGKGCLIAACTGLAGSAKIGRYVVMGGQAGVNDHVEIASNIVIAARASVFGNLDEEGIYSGYPAGPHQQQLRAIAHLRRLPRLVDRIKELELTVERLREKLGETDQ